MGQLREALAADRLCTLTGAGGVGKTRLALRVAAELVEDFADGVWVVDLSSTPEPDLLAHTVSGALGVREGGTGTYMARTAKARRLPATERLVEQLRHRHLLVVLDNCEHLVEPCAALVEALLRVCPGVKILCTSRERLGVDGELEYRVPPLAVPPPGRAITGEETAACESVALFLDRALHRRPDLRLGAEDVDAVGEICRRVDGTALAIELAAARVRLLSPRQILDLLDDRLGLLSVGSRTAPARHQTLRAMVDWSHDDLPEAQRTLLRRLSVFVGSFDLAAARHVCSGNGLEPALILDLLGVLVDKSLVETEQHAGVTRCRLLETIRTYGAEKLVQHGEHDLCTARHQDWYLSLAEEAEAGLTGPEQRRWLDRLEADHDNLRAVLAHADHGAGAENRLRLAVALSHFWLVRGFLTEGRRHLDETLAGVGTAPTALRAEGLAAAGHLAMFDSDIETAARRSEEALALSMELGHRRAEAWALRTLGRVASGRERFDEARDRQHRALILSRALGDAWGSAFVLTNLGNLELLAGRWDEASRGYEESLTLRRHAQDTWGMIWSLFRLGALRTWQGRFDEARELLGEGLDLSRDLRYGAGSVLTLLGLGEYHHLVDDQAGARAHYVEAHATACDLGDQTGISLAAVGLANVAVASGDGRTARHWLDTEVERAAGTRSTRAAWLRAEARLVGDGGDAARSAGLHRRVLELRRALGDVRGMTESVEDLGVLYACAGDGPWAATLLAAAAAARTGMGAPVPPLDRERVESAVASVPRSSPAPLDRVVAAELDRPEPGRRVL
jgi:predicted ATPase